MSFYPKVWNLKHTVLKIHHKDFSKFLSEDRALQENESDNQEGFEKTLFTLALPHNFVLIVFRIQTKDFSDILNDVRAPSL